MRRVTGLEYELYLQKRLAEAGLAFWTEAELRTMGFHKTPDCKLKVPVAVRSRSGGEHLVCWVDSKATFGDSRTHVKQVEEQYRTYVNRYGPGMVIYWFGYVDDLNTDPHVLLCDDFPDAASIIRITNALTLTPHLAQQQQQQQPAAALLPPAASATAAAPAAVPPAAGAASAAAAVAAAGVVRSGGLGAALGVGGRPLVPASPSKMARRVSGMAEPEPTSLRCWRAPAVPRAEASRGAAGSAPNDTCTQHSHRRAAAGRHRNWSAGRVSARDCNQQLRQLRQ
ncbi:hypothetical protein HYH02_010420 [Chlamydomonas schloesseri]|uniref:CDAN1-interacting nuclease 1 n=1 Tax=Chlamydomonas schloesseri TaxID=2026947 RepID=A0A835T7V9_9CHLO|nr:hypothetical protein HYH02_010420 [Chlamydomonas schloesseri]|eukprot:KAG2440542.1 hypothetical protein HYH02_010420 [Chlamydomonas schloesseri]